MLLVVHGQHRRQVHAEHGRLRVREVAELGLIYLLTVGEDEKFPAVRRAEALAELVAVLILLLAAHAQRLRRDLLEVALAREEQLHRVVRHKVLCRQHRDALRGDDARAPRRRVPADDLLELADDDAADAALALKRRLEVGNIFFQRIGLGRALEDVFAVDVAQLDFGDKVCLHLIETEARHEVGHDVGLPLGVADDGDGAVDVKQDLAEALQQVELGALFLQVKEHAPPDALHAPRCPLVEDLADAHHARIARDEDVEVAGKAVAQRREPEELLHDLLGVCTALEVDGELQTAEVGLVAHIGHLAQLARLDELGHLVDDSLHGRGVRDLIDLDDVLLRQVPPAGAHLEAAASGAVDLRHLAAVVEDLAAGRKIRRGQRREQVVVRILEIGDRRAADLLKVEAADLARHTDGDAEVCRHEHVREARRQQRRLFH